MESSGPGHKDKNGNGTEPAWGLLGLLWLYLVSFASVTTSEKNVSELAHWRHKKNEVTQSRATLKEQGLYLHCQLITNDEYWLVTDAVFCLRAWKIFIMSSFQNIFWEHVMNSHMFCWLIFIRGCVSQRKSDINILWLQILENYVAIWEKLKLGCLIVCSFIFFKKISSTAVYLVSDGCWAFWLVLST